MEELNQNTEKIPNENSVISQKEQYVIAKIDEQYDKIIASYLDTNTINSTISFNMSEIPEKYAQFYTKLGVVIGMHSINIDTNKKENTFGFKNCFGMVRPILHYIMWKKGKSITEDTIKDIYAEIVAVERTNITIETYTNTQYEEDINTLMKVFETPLYDIEKSTCNIEIESLMLPIFDSVEHIIHDRYKFLLDSTLSGIENYKGVYSNNAIYTIKDEKATTLDIKIDAFKKTTTNMISSSFSFLEAANDSHQFNVEEIYNNAKTTPDKPTYYPKKMLELAYGKKFTEFATVNYYNVKTDETYSTDTESIGFEAYYEYITPKLKKLFKEYIYYIFQRYIVTDNSIDVDISTKEKKDDYIKHFIKTMAIERGSYKDILGSEFYKSNILSFINYFVDSITTCFILATYDEQVEYNGIDKSIPSFVNVPDFRLKCCGTKTSGFATTQVLVDELNTKITSIGKYEAQKDSTGSETEILSVLPNSTNTFSLKDYSYTADFERANALPLFAYKALEQLVEKSDGKLALSWDNILLGRDTENNVIYARKTGQKGVVPLTKHNTHFIIASSRAGKGVMCYNIFLTAIASKLPMFYCDGKPDTAVALRQMQPNVVCVDNAQNDSGTMDMQNLFSIETRGWGSGHKETYIPPYLPISDKRAFGVMSYYRCSMLPIAMALYAHKYKDTPFCKAWEQATNGKGYIIVLDEISNYLNYYIKYFGMYGDISRLYISPKTIKSNAEKLTASCDKLDTSNEKYMEKIAQAEEKNKTEEIEKLYKAIEKNDEEKANTMSELQYRSVYWSNVIASMNNNSTLLMGSQDADAFLFDAQIFCIGQNIEKITEVIKDSEDAYALNDSTGLKKDVAHKNMVPWFKTLMTTPKAGSDIIIGYNSGFSRYGGAKSDEIMKAHLSASRRGWGYKELSAQNGFESIASGLEEVRNPKQNKTHQDYILFRPYLILNDAHEPQAHVRPGDTPEEQKEFDKLDRNNLLGARSKGDGQYVAQCLHNVENALAPEYHKGWTLLKEANLDPNNPNQLNPGIGVEGYINQMAASSGKESPIASLGQSGELADMFLQECFGYTDGWQMFLDDMRPEYILDLENLTAEDIPAKLSNYCLNPAIQNAIKTSSNNDQGKCAAMFGSITKYIYGSSDGVIKQDETKKQQESFNSDDIKSSTIQFDNGGNSQVNTNTNIEPKQDYESKVYGIYMNLLNQNSDLSRIIPWEQYKSNIIQKNYQIPKQIATYIVKLYEEKIKTPSVKTQVQENQQTVDTTIQQPIKQVQLTENNIPTTKDSLTTTESGLIDYKLKCHVLQIYNKSLRKLTNLIGTKLTVEQYKVAEPKIPQSIVKILLEKYNITLSESDVISIINSEV